MYQGLKKKHEQNQTESKVDLYTQEEYLWETFFILKDLRYFIRGTKVLIINKNFINSFNYTKYSFDEYWNISKSIW